jgi:hypothetical protein
VEGRAGGRPTQPATDPSPEYGNPVLESIEEASGTLTPKQSIAEVVEKTPASGEHASDRFYQRVFIARPVQPTHHEEKFEPPPVQIDSADTSHHRQDDPPNADDQRH